MDAINYNITIPLSLSGLDFGNNSNNNHQVNQMNSHNQLSANKECYTDADEHYYTESNFDKAKKAIFTPEKSANNIKNSLSTNSSSNLSSRHNDINMESVFHLRNTNTQSSNFNKEYDMLAAQQPYSFSNNYKINNNNINQNNNIMYEGESCDENKLAKKPYAYYTDNSNRYMNQQLKPKSIHNQYNIKDLTPTTSNIVSYDINNFNNVQRKLNFVPNLNNNQYMNNFQSSINNNIDYSYNMYSQPNTR